MQKQEFLELFESAIRAAKSARDDDDHKSSPEVLRCIDAMNRLKKAPVSLACDLVTTTSVGKRLTLLTDHKNSRIGYEGKRLYYLWLKMLYAVSGRKQSRNTESPVKIPIEKTGDAKRDKVREILQTSLAKVATEVVETEMKQRVIACDPSTLAVSVESTMFEKLGCFVGPHKGKYRSILFNMGDSNNPDLRRKVLIGEINGEKLATMETQEMGSEKMQMEVQLIKEKARLREENRMKNSVISDMVMI